MGQPSEQGEPGDERSLDEVLREAQDARDRASDDRRRAERLREQADRLLDRERQSGGSADDGETPPDAMDRWSRALERERGAGPRPGGSGDETEPLPPTGEGFDRTEPVDARPEEAQGTPQTVSEWLGEGREGEYTPEARERLREAARSAERAVEQQRVPSRHEELVRRVFRRWQQRAEGQPIAPLGEDAVPSGTASDGGGDASP